MSTSSEAFTARLASVDQNRRPLTGACFVTHPHHQLGSASLKLTIEVLPRLCKAGRAACGGVAATATL